MAMVGIVLVRMSPLSASSGAADGENRLRRTCDCAQSTLPAQTVGPVGRDVGFAGFFAWVRGGSRGSRVRGRVRSLPWIRLRRLAGPAIGGEDRKSVVEGQRVGCR